VELLLWKNGLVFQQAGGFVGEQFFDLVDHGFPPW